MSADTGAKKEGILLQPRACKSALLVVDVQKDFLTGGAVPIPDAEAIIPIVNDIRNSFSFDLAVFSGDKHTENHVSFASSHMHAKTVKPFTVITLADGTQQALWPDHCVDGTSGADLSEDLVLTEFDKFIFKGQHQSSDSSSIFYEGGIMRTELASLLTKHNVTDVYIAGIEPGQTALDCAKEGFDTFIIGDACRYLSKTTEGKMVGQFERAKITTINSSVLLEDREDKRKDVATYFKQHNIHHICEKLCASLIYHKPEDPRTFLIKEIEKLRDLENNLAAISLFDEGELEVYFGMIDHAQKGSVDGRTVKKAIEAMGFLADSSLGVNDDDSYTAPEFKVLIKKALDRQSGLE